MLKLKAVERRDIEDGIRRAVALETYTAEWDWYDKRKAVRFVNKAIEHSGTSKKQLSYQTGISSSSFTNLSRGIVHLRPSHFFKIVRCVYPEYAAIVEAEQADIERLRD
jgi:hypothetical protein